VKYWTESWGPADEHGIESATFMRLYPVVRHRGKSGIAIALVWYNGNWWNVLVSMPSHNWCSKIEEMQTSAGARRRATTIVKGIQ
jgi:hypothetical protein